MRGTLLGAMVVTACAALVAFGQALTAPSTAEEAGFPPAIEQTRTQADHVCPVAPPYRFTDTFGAPRPGGRTHRGADVFGEAGSAIVAITGGEVTKAVPTDDGTLGGARVWLEGDDGWWWYFAHLSRVDVVVGQRVEAGTQLGTMGNTGNAATTPPHLHVEQHLGAMGGPYVSPFPLLDVVCPQR